ncbi:hypothetical protein I3843_16G100300 [Carya illinoinensis]|uniref:Uncharacterized protein n=1 Tax=Carya illinoinensis TaxID=32201 RepID=A0A922A716_CARIL|nr:hypothetical protein I3760_16G103500 [Carya illinoinensis]KAG6673206.1 hypothetical protein I3842_16G099300 [Carya illinoinensis]KAG7942400.1 hypothetical protein I3843_16G100300 [Carya illinoinensis]
MAFEFYNFLYLSKKFLLNFMNISWQLQIKRTGFLVKKRGHFLHGACFCTVSGKLTLDSEMICTHHFVWHEEMHLFQLWPVLKHLVCQERMCALFMDSITANSVALHLATWWQL